MESDDSEEFTLHNLQDDKAMLTFFIKRAQAQGIRKCDVRDEEVVSQQLGLSSVNVREVEIKQTTRGAYSI